MLVNDFVSNFPSQDHVAAGGQPHDLSLFENVVKECEEEAGIPRHVVEQGLRPVGAISSRRHNKKSDTIVRDIHVCSLTLCCFISITDLVKTPTSQERVVLFTYDLYLPESFKPQAVDGEVHEFFRCDMHDLLDRMLLDYPDPIKPNCCVVMIDCLLRHGMISPDTSGYLDLVRTLRSGDCQ